MRRRERNAVDTLERSSKPESISGEAVVTSHTAVVLVDDALRVASARSAFTRVEALGLLRRVEAAAHDLPGAPEIGDVIDVADRRSRDQLLVPRDELLNPLLDIRLLLVA